MRLLHVLLAALVVVLSLTAVQVEAQKKRTVRNSVTASTNTTTSCTRGIRYRTWFTRFDTCDLPKVVKDACSKKDGRLAYDAIWDIRGFHGYNCGRDQKFYMKNSHENICGKVAATSTIEAIYASAGCLKVNPQTTTVNLRGNRNSKKIDKQKDVKKRGKKGDKKKDDKNKKKVDKKKKKKDNKKKPKKTLKQRRAERRKRREAARKRRAAARKKRRDAKRKRAAERKKRREAAKKKK